jgi:hypothetical protein
VNVHLLLLAKCDDNRHKQTEPIFVSWNSPEEIFAWLAVQPLMAVHRPERLSRFEETVALVSGLHIPANRLLSWHSVLPQQTIDYPATPYMLSWEATVVKDRGVRAACFLQGVGQDG